MYKFLLVIIFSVLCHTYAQRGGRTGGMTAGPMFVPMTTPHSDFHTGGAFGSGSPIPMPRTWKTPSHSFVPGTVNHENGYYSHTHKNGRTVSYTHIKGQYGPAVCNTQGGCGPMPE